MSERKHLSVENIWECAERCEEEFGRFALQREEKNVDLIPFMDGARSGRHLFVSFSTSWAALENQVSVKTETEN